MRTNTPNVYNTSSTITVLSHLVGLTKMERYAHQKNKKKRKRKKKEISTTGKKENTGKKKCSKSDEKRHTNTNFLFIKKRLIYLFLNQIFQIKNTR